MPPIKFGLGGVPLGNEFDVITDEEAYKTLDAAWSAGVRYYDVSPWYGLGLAERRFGYYLHNKNIAAALIVGARSEEQVLADVTSMQARIPPEFWAELKRQRLIEQNAPTPG